MQVKRAKVTNKRVKCGLNDVIILHYCHPVSSIYYYYLLLKSDTMTNIYVKYPIRGYSYGILYRKVLTFYCHCVILSPGV